VRGNLDSHFFSRGMQFFSGKEVIDQADAQRFGCINPFSGRFNLMVAILSLMLKVI
jgi:hypothetical protein